MSSTHKIRNPLTVMSKQGERSSGKVRKKVVSANQNKNTRTFQLASLHPNWGGIFLEMIWGGGGGVAIWPPPDKC